MTITFYPTWLTPVGLLPVSVTQNVTANIQLSAVRIAQCMGNNENIIQVGSQTVIELGGNAANVNSVMIDGVGTSFTILGNAIQFTHTLQTTDVFSISTSDPITFSLLYNNLPPGLSVSSSGLINGLVGIIPSVDPLVYTFAIRITDGFFSRDRQLSLTAIPVSTTVVPPGWGTLPSQLTATAGFQYYPLGSTNRGEPFLYQFSLYEPNGLQPYLTLGNFTGSNSVVSPFNAFPTGLVLNDRTGLINGAVNTVLPVGQYFFKVTMTDSNNDPITSGSGATPLVCSIQVNPPYNALSPFEKVIWNTAPGSLGTMISGTVCAMSVSAFCTTGSTVSYRLISSNLPPNLILNPISGNIEGTLGFISANQVYTFSIRAYVDGAYADRTFSIATETLYYNNEFLEMDFLLRVNDKKPMQNYYNSVISHSSVFRPTDQNFKNTYTIFLLRASIPASIQDVISHSNYDRPIKLVLGDHALAYAKIDGTVIYEVLYRPAYDPMSKAGGYNVINNIPIPSPVVYPESLPGHPHYIYPTSINNIRDEFVNTLGIPSTDPSLRHALGLGTAENLPLWMTSPQAENNSSDSALGYIPALVIAYLQPGTGAAILNTIRQRQEPIEQSYDDPNPMSNGYEIWFDQYYILLPGDPTTFDKNQTIFDLTTRFYSPDFSQQQLIRMPPYVPDNKYSVGSAVGHSTTHAIAPGYRTQGVAFNNGPALENPSLQVVDSMQYTYSFWYRLPVSVDSYFDIFWVSAPGSYSPGSYSNMCDFYVSGSDRYIYVVGANTTLGDSVEGQVGPIPNDGNWHHILCSVDVATPSGDSTSSPPKVISLLIDGVLGGFMQTTTNYPDFTNTTLNGLPFYIGNNDYASIPLIGDIADFWFQTGVSMMDGSYTFPTTNIRKFLSASGKPVDLGVNGELPTGTTPDIFLHVDPDTGVADDIANNIGTGGTFTILNGELTLSLTNPSD